MSQIHATLVDGAIVPDRSPEWPDGTRLVIDTAPLTMMTEDEQGDDPESIARWLTWFDSLEPLVASPEEEAGLQEWKAKMKAFNVEAVRRQMEDGIL